MTKFLVSEIATLDNINPTIKQQKNSNQRIHAGMQGHGESLGILSKILAPTSKEALILLIKRY